MAILKNHTNVRGLSAGYHRVAQVVINATDVLATIHSWPTKEMFEAAGPMALPGIVDTVSVPNSVLTPDTLSAVEQWLISNQISSFFGGVLDTDTDELTRAKTTKQRLLREQRDAREASGVVVDGIGAVATDVASQRLLTGAAVLALIATQAQQPFFIEWTLVDLSSVQLSAAEVIACSVAVGTYVAGVFAAHRVAVLAVEAASTIEEVNLVNL